jgi:hypothetical protein
MSEAKMGSQHPLEQSKERAGEDAHLPGAPAANLGRRPPAPGVSPASPARVFTTGEDAGPATPAHHHNGNGSAPSAAHVTHRDLNQIIARAHADLSHLREELTRHKAQIATIIQERDELQQQYAHLRENYVEAVHLAADEAVRRAAESLRATPGSLPALFAPIHESIIQWSAQQQAEREAVLRQKLETIEQQAATIRQELLLERETLQAERERLAQERATLIAQFKAREAGLQHRWLAKAWGTAGIMFLVLPALQFYLLTQHASSMNIIIIPTTICLTLTLLINFARARKKADTPKPQ